MATGPGASELACGVAIQGSQIPPGGSADVLRGRRGHPAGYRRLHVILRRDGHVLNRERTQRLYREEGLSVRRRRGRKRALGTRAPLVTEAMANARWSVDFASRTCGSCRTSSLTGGASAS